LLKEQPQTAGVPVTLVTDVGVRLPAHLTANGRSILAHLSAAQVRALFPSSATFIHRTERGPNSLAELRRILQTERAQGWAEEAGMITEGLQSVAACAFDHAGRPVAAFSATHRTADVGRGRSWGGAPVDPGAVRTRTGRLVLNSGEQTQKARDTPLVG
jgi:DNA-binding IclR family transcriptional regulator